MDIRVCAPEYDACVQELFTIDEPADLSDDKSTNTEVVSNEKSSEESGCLIATAAGSELAPQVQMLREIRDNQLMNTE